MCNPAALSIADGAHTWIFGVLFSQFPSVLVQSSVEVTWTLWRKTTKRGIGLFSLSAPDAEALHQYTLAGGRGAKGQGGWESEKPTHTRTFTRALHGQSTPSHSRTNCDELLLLHVEYREQHSAVHPATLLADTNNAHACTRCTYRGYHTGDGGSGALTRDFLQTFVPFNLLWNSVYCPCYEKLNTLTSSGLYGHSRTAVAPMASKLIRSP